MDTNDMRFASPGGFSTGVEFESYVRDAFDVAAGRGRRGQPKMLSIGLHGRVIADRGACRLAAVLAHMRAQPDVWFAQRVDIAGTGSPSTRPEPESSVSVLQGPG